MDLNEFLFNEEDRLVGVPNYLIWAFRVKLVLQAYDVWDLVEPAPPSSSSGSSTSGVTTVNRQPSTEIVPKKMDLSEFCFSENDKLVGSKNYSVWAFRIEQLLRAQDLWDVVERAPPSSSSGASTSGVTTVTSQQSTEILQKKMDTFLFILAFTISDGILPTVILMRNDPAGLWDTLRRRHERAARLLGIVLKKELLSLRMTNRMSLEEFLAKIKNVRDQLAHVLEAVDDQTLIDVVLRGLPSFWESFKCTFRSSMHFNHSITFADLEEQLREYDEILFGAHKSKSGRRKNTYRQARQN